MPVYDDALTSVYMYIQEIQIFCMSERLAESSKLHQRRQNMYREPDGIYGAVELHILSYS